jgi:hypothetical protein
MKQMGAQIITVDLSYKPGGALAGTWCIKNNDSCLKRRSMNLLEVLLTRTLKYYLWNSSPHLASSILACLSVNTHHQSCCADLASLAIGFSYVNIFAESHWARPGLKRITMVLNVLSARIHTLSCCEMLHLKQLLVCLFDVSLVV